MPPMATWSHNTGALAGLGCSSVRDRESLMIFLKDLTAKNHTSITQKTAQARSPSVHIGSY